MNWRKLGFTQRKPRVPGVYFIAPIEHMRSAPPQRHREGWDVADVLFFAGSFSNVHENREEFAHWRISTMECSFAWRPGMWMKGPISPFPTPAATPEGGS